MNEEQSAGVALPPKPPAVKYSADLAATLPDSLTERAQWVVWRYEVDKSGERWTKTPYDARSGHRASSTDAASWSTFGMALAACRKGRFDGIGFVVNEADPFAGIDLDHCRDAATGVIDTAALDTVRRFGSYAEISPSGTGVRIFVVGKLPEGRRKDTERGIEMYDHARYLTVTGNALNGCRSVEDGSVELAQWHAEVFPPEPLAPPLSLVPPTTLTDAEVVEKARNAKNGAAFILLHDHGDVSGFPSESEAVASLCARLAFYTRDAGQIENIVTGSALGQGKWSKRRDYRQRTIAGALKLVTAQYQAPKSTPHVVLRGRAASRFIRAAETAETAETSGASGTNANADPDDADEQAVNNGLYAVQNGRTMLAVKKEKADASGSSETGVRGFVWDGAACIAGEIRDEDGATIFEIEGRSLTGRRFQFEIEAAKMSDSKVLSGAIRNHAGAESVIYAGMEKHIAPAIQSFTDKTALRYGRRFSRVGWTREGTEFIMPGIEPPDVIMMLSSDLPYRVVAPEPGAEVLEAAAADALTALLRSHRPALTTIMVCHALMAPLAQLCGWRDDKFALFVAARTGSFKTSVAALVMCLYGDFNNEDKLLKFGMGATTNAMMSYTADAADVPLLIDNFKPGTGGGQKEAQNFIHGVLEGGERKRLNRDGTRRAGKDIHCWPLFTGEDVIDDAASVARTLIVNGNYDGGIENPALTQAQGAAHLLPQVGGAVLAWLMSEPARTVAVAHSTRFGALRGKWAAQLRNQSPNMVNASRVASSLALCECAWSILLQCPALAPVLGDWTPAFLAGLGEVAAGMANYTAQTHEANRYLAAIQAMLQSERGYLVPRLNDPDKDDRRAFLGWEDDEYVYLQPDNAYREVLEYLRGSGGLNGLGMNTIHRQLDQLGHLAKKGKGHLSPAKRLGSDNKLKRVLWIPRSRLFEDENDE